MLETLGLKDFKQLFSNIPSKIIQDNILLEESGASEQELAEHVEKIASKNRITKNFLGAGLYNHYIPALVDTVSSRPEFYTSYTPYQAEASQGVLQALFEYQGMMCALTGMDVSNAGMYDGSTALAEAALMAVRTTGLAEIAYPSTLNPLYQQVLETYATSCGFKTKKIEVADGTLTKEEVEKAVDEDTAGLIVQNPNFFGLLEDENVFESLKDEKTFLIECVVEATSLGILKPFAKADIICGDGQTLGNPINFGGPSFGFLTCKQDYLRSMPGRIVGETTDIEGKRGYVLTFQTREQHIRRAKATSNICTAESLNCTRALAYLACMGPKGLRDVSESSHKNAVYLSKELSKIEGITLVYDKPFYNEILVKSKKPLDVGADVSRFYHELKNHYLLATTEIHSKPDLDELISEVSK